MSIPNDVALFVIALLLGIVAFFLKSLHADVQGIRLNLQRIELDVAVKSKADQDRDRRIENLEDFEK